MTQELSPEAQRAVEQVEKLLRLSDSRFWKYSQQFGDSSWELDALDPAQIHQLIGDAILRFRDAKLWDEMVAQEADDRRRLEMMTEELQMEDRR